jgi:putative two-component system response regulator
MRNGSPNTVLVVDDMRQNLDLMCRVLTAEGYAVWAAADGVAALKAMQRHKPDLVLLDVMMPGLDGFEVCRQIKGDPQTRLTPVVLLTASNGHDDRIQGIEAGADDFLSKPPDWQELVARVRSLVRLKAYTDEMDSAESLIVTLALTIEARDAYTEGHCERLARYATAMGQRLGLGEEDLAALYRGGFLHDLGKIGVPDAILLKAGRLTPAEVRLMQRHTILGDSLCSHLQSLRRVRPIVRQHHERLDGSGYPDGLRGDAISMGAQIMGVVDVFDALTTTRPYRLELTAAEACGVLMQEVERGWRSRSLVETLAGLAAEDAFLISDRTVGSRCLMQEPALTCAVN